MKNRLLNVSLIVLILFVIIGCGSVEVRYVGAEKMGYYEVVLNYNGDTDYHMGQLYGEVLVSQYPSMEAGFANYFSALSTEEYATIMARVQSINSQIPREYRDFIKGLASKFSGGINNDKADGMLSEDEVSYFSLTGDVHRSSQCSVVAAYESMSATNKPIIGRLLDWSNVPHGAIYYIKKGNKKIMNIGATLLSQSISTGLNQYGIFVATLDAPTGEPFPNLSSDTYYSYHFDLRYALETYNKIEDIANYLSQKKYTFNHLVVIGDASTMKVLENNLSGTRALRDSASELNTGVTWEFSNAIATVNAFVLRGNFDNFSISPYNTYRWQSIKDQLALYTSDNIITVDEMKKIATYYGTDINQITDGGIMTFITQQIVIYDSASSSLQMFFRNNRSSGTENTTDTFDVDNPNFLEIPVRF